MRGLIRDRWKQRRRSELRASDAPPERWLPAGADGARARGQVTSAPSPWEFYAARELQTRLPPAARGSVLAIPEAANYADGTLLVTQVASLSTSIDVIN